VFTIRAFDGEHSTTGSEECFIHTSPMYN
jgi:hypothetical protein